MPGKIFVNYRRDDVPGDARGVRDGLAAKFGKANVFMDVDDLLVGQRFDVELAKALDACDMLIAVIGPRWMGLLKQRTATAERDYVREEIAAALARKITVISVRVGHEGSMPPLPRRDELPEDIRDLVLHQKLDVAHERFGRDIAELIDGITAVRQTMTAGERPGRPSAVHWGWVGACGMAVLAMGYVIAAQLGVPVPWPKGPATVATDDASRSAEAARVKAAADTDRLADAADKARRDQEAREKAFRDELAAKKLQDEARTMAAAEPARPDPALAVKPRSGQSFRDCKDGCPEMVVVPAGRFKMGVGSAARDVTIQRAFAVGKLEITFDEWAACVAGGGCSSNRSPSDQDWGKGRRPVINVSWNDAKEYVAWLSRKTGQTYRLLTEDEWEYAARAGTTTQYWWGDKFDGSKANNNASQTVPVGQYPANAFGLHDMHGNVREWCEEAFDPSSRVVRGGSWANSILDLRSAYREGGEPDNRDTETGFRVARVLSPS